MCEVFIIMGKCKNCGKMLMPGTKFCPSCGENQESDAIKVNGKIYKCPSCGETLEAFSIKCPTCGYELRGTKATGAVKELADKLEKLQSKSNVVSMGVSKIFNSNHLSSVDNQKIDTIRNFSIPNNREDIIELMILAVSNINPEAFNELGSGTMNTGRKKSERAISEAWISKYDQAFQKARIAFPDEPVLANIESDYQDKMKAVRKEKNKYRNFGLFCILAFICLVILGIIASLLGL